MGKIRRRECASSVSNKQPSRASAKSAAEEANIMPRIPNALKHGIYAATAILPGESVAEFKELHAALIAEWKPVGPSEHEAVLSIAEGMWRKRRLQRFIQVRSLKNSIDPRHPTMIKMWRSKCLPLMWQRTRR